MATYVLVYKGGGMPATEEARQASFAAWGKWYEDLGAATTDGGNPFGPSATIASDGTVSEGTTSALTGYTILSADSLHAACVLAKGCPILGDGGSVEVYETFNAM